MRAAAFLAAFLAACTPFQRAAVADVLDLAEQVCVEGEDWRACLERCEQEDPRTETTP